MHDIDRIQRELEMEHEHEHEYEAEQEGEASLGALFGEATAPCALASATASAMLERNAIRHGIPVSPSPLVSSKPAPRSAASSRSREHASTHDAHSVRSLAAASTTVVKVCAGPCRASSVPT